MEIGGPEMEDLVNRGIAVKKQVDDAFVYWIPDDEIRELRQQIKAIEQQLSDVDVEQVRKEQIQRLHEYNELKDATALLLGKLAEIEHCTLTSIYARYELTNE